MKGIIDFITSTGSKNPNPKYKRGFIIALYFGVPMIYLSYNAFWMYKAEYLVEFVPIFIEMMILIAGIFLLNKNDKISFALFAVYLILIFMNHQPLWRLAHFVSQQKWYRFDYKYMYSNVLFGKPERILEFIFAAFTLYGLNKANRLISLVSASLFLIWISVFLFTSAIHIYDAIPYESMFEFLAYYSELVIPIMLMICAIWPRCIHASVKIIDSCFAIRLVLFIGSDLIRGFVYGFHPPYTFLNIPYLFSVSWMPLITIFGLNAVLTFPIPFKELAKVFGISALIVGIFAIVASAQEGVDSQRKSESEKREIYMNKMRDNILSWKSAGFSDNFTTDAAMSMLKEGRITYKEYQWLIGELLK